MNKSLVCVVTNAPVRIQASDAAEMVTQVLYGEEVLFLEKGLKDWIKIRCSWDNYEGWVDQKQFEDSTMTINGVKAYCIDRISSIESNGSNKLIGLGSVISKELINLNPKTSVVKQKDGNVFDEELFDQLVNLYKGTAYLWGGRSITGIDCSGLVQVIYNILGKQLPRDASQQCEVGELVGFLKESRKGDLAFFENEKEKIVHVGILLGNEEILHAAGEVKIDSLTTEGIYNKNKGGYTHKLRLIKRVFS